MIKEKFATAKKFAQDHKPDRDVVLGVTYATSAIIGGFVLYKYAKTAIELMVSDSDYQRLFEAVSDGHEFKFDGEGVLWDTTVNPDMTL